MSYASTNESRTKSSDKLGAMQIAAEEGKLRTKFAETSRRKADDNKFDAPSYATLNYTVGKPLEVITRLILIF